MRDSGNKDRRNELQPKVSLETGKRLVHLARDALELYLKTGRVERPRYAERPGKVGGVFCTLNTYPSGDLRGCIGQLDVQGSLEDAVVTAAVSAAHDPRFPPLQAEELAYTTIEVSILGPFERIEKGSGEGLPADIEPGMHGLLLQHGVLRSLLLPQAWKELPDPYSFLATLCFKAGIPREDAWRDREAVLSRFRVQVFCEKEPGGEVVEEHGPWL